MEELKVTVTQDKREDTIKKIFNLIEMEYEEINITAAFTKKLLEDAISVIDKSISYIPLSTINNSYNP